MEGLQLGDGSRLSHAYIVASASETARQQNVQTLSAAAVCSGTGKRPCGMCRDCRKARDGVHPDIIHIRRETDDKGKQKREIRVDQIRDMIGQAQIMSNEAPGKAFVIHEAETMNPNAQNALLKLLEEPPKGVVLILSTATPAMLLPTIRSRCVEITSNDDAPEADPEAEKAALEYLKLVAAGKKSALLAWCNDRAAASDAAFCNQWTQAVQSVLTDLLCQRRKTPQLTPEDCWRILEVMERCQAYLAVNVGIKHLFGAVAVKSIGGAAPVETRNK